MCCRSVLKGRSLLSDTGRLALRRPGAAVSPSADLARPAPICRSIRPFTGQRSAAAIFVSIFQCRHRLLECAGARAVPAPGVCPLSQIVDGRPGRCRGMGFCPGLNGCRGYFWHFISAVRPGARMMALVSAPLCRLSPPPPVWTPAAPSYNGFRRPNRFRSMDLRPGLKLSTPNTLTVSLFLITL